MGLCFHTPPSTLSSNGNSSDTVSICQAGGEQLSARPRHGGPCRLLTLTCSSGFRRGPPKQTGSLEGRWRRSWAGSGGTTQEPLAT